MTTLVQGASTKFKFVKKVDGDVRVYQGKTARTGATVEFTGDFAVKAALNPDFEIVRAGPKKGQVKHLSVK